LGEKRRLFLVRLDLQQDLHPVRRGGGFQNIADRGRPVYQANIFHFKDAAELQQAKWSGLESRLKADGTVTHDFLPQCRQAIDSAQGCLAGLFFNLVDALNEEE
jgi:hypothetical protein